MAPSTYTHYCENEACARTIVTRRRLEADWFCSEACRLAAARHADLAGLMARQVERITKRLARIPADRPPADGFSVRNIHDRPNLEAYDRSITPQLRRQWMKLVKRSLTGTL